MGATIVAAKINMPSQPEPMSAFAPSEEAEKTDMPGARAAPPTLGESFAEYMRRPEIVAERAERERQRAERAAAAVAEHGSEQAVFADTLIEVALRTACEPLLGPGQTWDGVYELAGWSWLQGRDRMPEPLRAAAAGAWPMPDTVAAAWVEYQARDRREGDRYALFPDWSPHAFTEARRGLIEEMLDTCPARSLADLRARLSWLDELNEIDATSQREQRVRLATLRADFERMAMRMRAQGRALDADVEAPCTPAAFAESRARDGAMGPTHDRDVVG